jgi:predicted nucleic acid-binding protein
LENWLVSVIHAFGERLLNVDRNVANIWGSMTVGRTLPLVDGLLAATALAHDLTLVTRNTKDFKDCGARLFNPWEP